MMSLQKVMKQAQELQQKMAEMQSKLVETEATGSAGGGLVKVITNCKGEVKKVQIDKSLLNVEEAEMLEDLIIAAFNNAKLNADTIASEEMKKLGAVPDLLKSLL